MLSAGRKRGDTCKGVLLRLEKKQMLPLATTRLGREDLMLRGQPTQRGNPSGHLLAGSLRKPTQQVAAEVGAGARGVRAESRPRPQARHDSDRSSQGSYLEIWQESSSSRSC